MTLVDAGPLVALIDAGEPDHQACRDALVGVPRPLVTTWPALTEAMHLLVRAGGSRGREALWRLVLSGRLEVADLTGRAVARSAELMAEYADTPMDVADAMLVALAEERGHRRVFTLDSDFTVYRIHGRQRFEIVPI
ncbi:MAG: hypothetical protein AVDCRST_MAG35-1974 [uncultured Quadrisphaera sp.]|uniref:Ribonuclease VapC n=1 Tax=uncultured Quadrisphaera sp. TaxID=904978 RepID=A0A6J4PN85_9ACTN|nr:MAG: hypothetical protein AVDCRST_MAG35-1974 [uncultured Quadrisphaera sp.]